MLSGVMMTPGLSVFGQDAAANSPFLPDGYAAKTKPAEALKPDPVAKYELRGIMVLGGVHTFSLFDKTSKKGFWISLGESAEGISVSNYYVSDESVLVRGGGFSRRLKLKEAKIIALKVAPPKPRALPGVVTGGTPSTGTAATNSRSATGGTGSQAAINNLSDDEVRARMQKVAEEIRRRRAVRRTMAEKAAKNPAN
jgi:hypothetical protein